jgi:hypothetical protein
MASRIRAQLCSGAGTAARSEPLVASKTPAIKEALLICNVIMSSSFGESAAANPQHNFMLDA